MKAPDEFVVVVRLALVRVSVTRTVALAAGSPAGVSTVPRSAAVVSWAITGSDIASMDKARVWLAARVIDFGVIFIALPSVCCAQATNLAGTNFEERKS
jgi:hypothetical protein